MSGPSASASPAEPAGTRGSPLLPLFLTVLVDVLALTIMLPLLPFMAKKYGASPLVVTSLFASYSVCQFISGPMLGRVSDRIGRKPTLLFSQAGTFVGLLVLAFANRLEFLFVGRMIDGLTAGNLSIAQAYITDVTKPENRTRAFGLIGVAFGTGFTLGPGLAGIASKHFGENAPVLVAAGLSLLSVILTATLLPALPPKNAGMPSRRELFERYMTKGPTRGRLLEMFAFIWSFSTLTSGLALVMSARFDYGVEQVGYLFTYVGVVGGLVQGGLGRAAKALGEARLSLIGLACMVVGYLALAWAGSLAPLLIALGIGAVGSAVTRPALTTLITKTVLPQEYGLALGINQSLNSIALVFAPLVGGYLIGRGALSQWALVAALFASAAMALRVLLPIDSQASAKPSDSPPGGRALPSDSLPHASEKETRDPEAV